LIGIEQRIVKVVHRDVVLRSFPLILSPPSGAFTKVTLFPV